MFFCAGCRLMTSGGENMCKNLNRTCIPFGGEGFHETKCHSSHELMQVEHFPHIFWCRKCGGMSSKQAKSLVIPCKGHPTEWGEYVLKCLHGGYLPKTVFQLHKIWVGDSILFNPPQGELVFRAARGLPV